VSSRTNYHENGVLAYGEESIYGHSAKSFEQSASDPKRTFSVNYLTCPCSLSISTFFGRFIATIHTYENASNLLLKTIYKRLI